VESRKFWTQLQGAYGISDEGGLALLSLAATAYKRLLEAQRLIDAEGIVVKDRFGHAKPHPACTLERDSRISVLAALRELGLDLEPVKRLAR
jgi:P27 family predicted phage terminase small subunit